MSYTHSHHLRYQSNTFLTKQLQCINNNINISDIDVSTEDIIIDKNTINGSIYIK